jgi:hypothetical protein
LSQAARAMWAIISKFLITALTDIPPSQDVNKKSEDEKAGLDVHPLEQELWTAVLRQPDASGR